MTAVPHIIRRGEIDIIQIDNAACSAEISLFGGHVLHWQPSGHKPVLWMSENAIYDGKTALRGGIPVCWPWFGPIDGKGRHGLVRDRHWTLDTYTEAPQYTELQLSIELSEQDNPWPHPNKLIMQLRLGETLEQTLSVHNNSDAPLCFAYALHNYFHTSKPENIQIDILNNAIFDDSISGETQQVDRGDTVYGGPIDRIYLNNETATLTDRAFGRHITIEKFGSQNWVLWNPGPEAQSMKDVHKNGEQQFLCFEVANTGDIILSPESLLKVGQCIRVVSC